MKPDAFKYERPLMVEDVLLLLEKHGDEAKLLAGGQSLVPMLNFRLARPKRLIDLNRVRELSYILQRAGTLRIGAMTRLSTLERSPLINRKASLLSEALPFVGHSQIRNRGTIGGSIAHADPAAELPVALTALGALFHLRSLSTSRVLDAAGLFRSAMTTAIEPDELLVEIELPPPPRRSGAAFVEFARRHGDFALAGAAVRIALDANQKCAEAAIVLLGAAPVPLRVPEAEGAIVGRFPDQAAAADAGRHAAEVSNPRDDVDGSSAYRRELLAGLVEQGVLVAAARAGIRAVA